MNYSKEEQKRIYFLVYEVMKRLDKGATIEIGKEKIDICIKNTGDLWLCEWLYSPITEDAVYAVLRKLDEKLEERRADTNPHD